MVALAVTAFAGDLNSPAAPTDAGSAMFTLEDIYNRLNLGTAGIRRSGAFTEPGAAPGSTMHTLNDIMNKAPAIDAQGASSSEVVAGKKFWGLVSGSWGPRIGTMPNVGAQTITPGSSSQVIFQGYHDGTGTVAGDANLVTGNIRAGTTIFGISGKTQVVDTSSGNAAAGELMAGKKAWVAGSEITGTLETKTLSAATGTVAAGNYAATTLSAVDADLVTGNIRAGTAIFGISGKTEVVDTTSGNAAAGELLAGKKAWVAGSEITGTLETKTLSAATGTVAAGNYAATTLSAVDADLVTGNIRAGTAIFGISGKTQVVDTTSGNALATNLSRGKKAWVGGEEVTGTLAGGVSCPATCTFSTLGRWCDNGNGTITDTTTGLIWFKDAGLSGAKVFCASNSADVFSFLGSLENGANGLTDGSAKGDWRLPTLTELKRLTVGTEPVSYSSMQFFSNINNSFYYWTSSGGGGATSEVTCLNLVDVTLTGQRTKCLNMNTAYVLPVRSGP
ncbi:MAG TPA: DUF1566 domain-containing protein [Candidatus Ozemobacteraceae bacterium]|nr:DUF1566 domain-containing protein [Candidatus Ozemobacteraceae bacterium]